MSVQVLVQLVKAWPHVQVTGSEDTWLTGPVADWAGVPRSRVQPLHPRWPAMADMLVHCLLQHVHQRLHVSSAEFHLPG